MPRVSVVIPSYNHEKYIAEAIQSVLDQTYQDFEIIIVDDGSVDGTVDEIKKFSDPRIKLFCFEKNRGACTALRKCLDEARGEYVSLLNSDDYYATDKLEKQVAFLEQHPEIGAVFSNARIIDEDGNDLKDKGNFYYNIFNQPNRNRYQWLEFFFYQGNCICHPSILIRKVCYDTIGYYDERMARLPDFDFWVRLCLKFEIYILPEKLINFRIRRGEENASGNRPETRIAGTWELAQILNNYLQIKSIEDFWQVFPNYSSNKDNLDENLIPYYIADLALKINSSAYQYFALETLYCLLSDDNIAQKLSDKHGFTYVDFTHLTAKYDVFNLFANFRTSVFVDTGAGFNPTQVVQKPYLPDSKNFIFVFDLSGFQNVKSLRWDPVESMCKVKITSVTYTDDKGREHLVDTSKITSNGEFLNGGICIFDTHDPMFYIPVEKDITQLKIIGEWEISDDNLEEQLADKNNELFKLQSKLAEKNETINNMMVSRSWRLTAPLRKAIRIARYFRDKLKSRSNDSELDAKINYNYKKRKNIGQDEFAANVDIIVPIYNAYDDVVACCESVFANTNGQYRLILVNDASTDPRIEEYLKELEQREIKNLVVLRNPKNLGFVGTTNHGLEISRGHVVLLNSDTEVPPDWLERLLRVAGNNTKVGTITPFSNNATICSFPNFCKDNHLPEGFDVNKLDKIFAANAPKQIIDIPTAVGFCMFITSDCLDSVGLLDEGTFGRGYGEENDFCMRAESMGFRNVLCPDLFVYHKGSMSFGLENKVLLQENLKKLMRKHPGYSAKVQEFIARDPIRPLRQAVQYAISYSKSQKGEIGVLHILHNQGGGTEVHVEDLIQNLDKNVRLYELKAYNERFEFIDRNFSEPLIYNFSTAVFQEDAEWFGKLTATFNINLIHVHNIIGYPADFKETIMNSGVPYIFMAHDYFAACPKHNLLKPDSVYCQGINDIQFCQQCIQSEKDREISGIDISTWRAEWFRFLKGAQIVLTPSRATAEILKVYYPDITIRALEHGVAPLKKSRYRSLIPARYLKNYKIRVCLLGAIGPHKGSRLLEKLIDVTKRRNLPIQWIVVGYTDRRQRQYVSPDYRVIIHGPYNKEEIAEILDSYNADLVFLPAIWPETYSYTLSEAWLAGLPVLASDLGALGQRINETGAGWTLRNLEIDTIIAQLMLLIKNTEQLEAAKDKVKQLHLPDLEDMAKEYNGLYNEYAGTKPVTDLPKENKFIENISALPFAAQDSDRPMILRNMIRVARKVRNFIREV